VQSFAGENERKTLGGALHETYEMHKKTRSGKGERAQSNGALPYKKTVLTKTEAARKKKGKSR